MKRSSEDTSQCEIEYCVGALKDMMPHIGAIKCCENMFKEKFKEQEYLLNSKTEAVDRFKSEAAKLADLVKIRRSKMEKDTKLSNHLNYSSGCEKI